MGRLEHTLPALRKHWSTCAACARVWRQLVRILLCSDRLRAPSSVCSTAACCDQGQSLSYVAHMEQAAQQGCLMSAAIISGRIRQCLARPVALSPSTFSVMATVTSQTQGADPTVCCFSLAKLPATFCFFKLHLSHQLSDLQVASAELNLQL